MARQYKDDYFLLYLHRGQTSSPLLASHTPPAASHASTPSTLGVEHLVAYLEQPHAADDLHSIDDILRLVDDDLGRHDPLAAQAKLLAPDLTSLVHNVRRGPLHYKQAIASVAHMTHRQVVAEIKKHIDAAWHRIEELTRQNA